METTSGDTLTMEPTRARDYYRRAGLSTLVIRNSPNLRRRHIHRIQVSDLAVNQMVDLFVYPELTVRSKPWQFYGMVVRFWDEAVILRQLSGDQTGTILRIPYRYFEDGRVYLKDFSL